MTIKNNVYIYTAFHKQFKLPDSKFFIPVHVGKAHSKENLGFVGDDAGDNISNQNPNYCELTMLYRIWKNKKFNKGDYIGLAHYRRLFDVKKLKNIDKYDIILPKKIFYDLSSVFTSLERQYKCCHIPEDFDIMKTIVYSKYPEYKKLDYVFSKINFSFLQKGFFYNMFIMKKPLFNEYCDWLFPILFECEKKLQISQHHYQARVFGFLGERLLNLFVEKKRLDGYNIKTIPIDFIT